MYGPSPIYGVRHCQLMPQPVMRGIPIGAHRLPNGGPYRHPSCMSLDVLTDAMSTPGWITATAATVACAEKVARGAGWMARMAKRLTDPGDAPGGQAGEDQEFFEDVLRDWRGGSPQWWRDPQGGGSLLERWKRRLRRRERTKRAQQRAARFPDLVAD